MSQPESLRARLIALLVLCSPVAAHAQLNGHNSLGDFGLLSGSQPAPGFYLAAFYNRYDSDLLRDRNGDPLTLSPDDPGSIGVNAFVPVLYWVTDAKILGANYGAMAFLPFANIALAAPILGFDLRTGTALGDLYLRPVDLGWHRERADFKAGIGLFAPIGRYEDGADDNTGLGMWSFELFGGATVFFDEQRSWHVATTAFYETHGDIKDSDQRVGDLLTLEGGIGKSFKEGTISVGAAYFAQWKVTADEFGLDFELPGTFIGKHRVFGVGPDLTLPLVLGDKLIAIVNARYFWESGARTKTEGTTLAINVTFPIPSVSIN